MSYLAGSYQWRISYITDLVIASLQEGVCAGAWTRTWTEENPTEAPAHSEAWGKARKPLRRQA